MRRGHKSERGDQNFAAQIQRADRYFQRHSAIAHRDHVLYPEISGQPQFEFAHQWAVVGKPATIQNFVDSLEELRSVTDIRPAYVNRLGESRRASEICQVGW
jgi:hypothetical protein